VHLLYNFKLLYAPVIQLQTVNPQNSQSMNQQSCMTRLVPFPTNYISSYRHQNQTFFNSHHLVMLIYLISITNRVKISIVIGYIFKQCTSNFILTLSIFFSKNTISQSQTTCISNHTIHIDFSLIHSYPSQFSHFILSFCHNSFNIV